MSRAADELALSQSATSTALGEFERQFNTQLFDRIGKSLRLNELGQVLLPHAVQLLEHAVEIESLLARQTDFGTPADRSDADRRQLLGDPDRSRFPAPATPARK